jgi:hypothetical protein
MVWVRAVTDLVTCPQRPRGYHGPRRMQPYVIGADFGFQIGKIVETPEKRELRGTRFSRDGYT